jgi:demethylmenaquinone methyltransferase / 2-methoxy-6-polyprenyl-1,4-benzoquinol methylase
MTKIVFDPLMHYSLPMPDNNSTIAAPKPNAMVHAPHAPLTAYYQHEEERQSFLRNIFDSTASDYDRIEKMLAFGTGPWYRRQALMRAGLGAGMRVADVGVGTGLVAREAATLTGDASLITGIDPSSGMMAAAQLPAGVTLLEGRAEAIPLADASVDFISMGYALRHIGDLEAAFKDFHRVLKPGGKFCVLEITKPETRIGQIALKTYMRVVVPLLAKLVARGKNTPLIWRYYWDSIEACAPPANVMATLNAAGFSNVNRYCELGIFSEYRGEKPKAL